MASKRAKIPTSSAPTLTHNPFAGLASEPALIAQVATSSSAAPTTAPPLPARPPEPPPATRVRLRLETKGRAGKVVTRISGLPLENLAAIAARLRQGLGCGGVVEGPDLLLLGTLLDRASAWLERAGDLRAITEERPQREPRLEQREPAPAPPLRSGTSLSGTRRADVRPGRRVAIVLKADQATGTLTEGIVRDLLTPSASHPRGIKVRLESGEVGRVRVVHD